MTTNSNKLTNPHSLANYEDYEYKDFPVFVKIKGRPRNSYQNTARKSQVQRETLREFKRGLVT